MKRPKLVWTRPAVGTLVGVVAVVIAFAALAWHRRWIADDGLIVIRTVRNVLAGNGPVFNAFERAEANTSTLWTYALVLIVGVLRTEPVFTSVVVGWAFSVCGVALALDATRRFHRARGSTALVLPAGALVLIGTQPFWDFATSGLETGLATLWLAACWWLLVALRAESSLRSKLAIAFVFGLGPLVRPDFAVVSVVFCIGFWLLVRPSWKLAALLLGVALALPVTYEVFRAGYYGVLVPLPAITKSAGDADWARGIAYLLDYVTPYFVYVPVVILAILACIALLRRRIVDRVRILIGTTTVAGLLMTAFVLRVGGDFMHGRMMLPPTFMLLFPVMLLPVRRITAPALGAIAIWAVVALVIRTDGKPHSSAERVFDERHNYANWTRSRHPTEASVFLQADIYSTNLVNAALANHRHRLISEGGLDLAANPAYSAPVMYAVGRLGTGGATAPLDGIVIDVLGLANPLGAHITVNQPGMTGHEKSLPWAWIRADYTDPATDARPRNALNVAAIRAARHAMGCGDLAELFASVREPMTASRFLANLEGSVRRTRLVVPSDPFDAEKKFCPDMLPRDLTNLDPDVVASSSYEGEGWGVDAAVDGLTTSTSESKGFSSEVGPTQWIEVHLHKPSSVSTVTLYPRADDLPGAGFPIDFQIEIWNGSAWIPRVTRTAVPNPGSTAQVFTWSPADQTDRVRITATKLPTVSKEGPRLQFAEIEVK